jgi:hypothetical protein
MGPKLGSVRHAQIKHGCRKDTQKQTQGFLLFSH